MGKIVINSVAELDTLRQIAFYMNITVRQSRQSGVARATCPD